MNTAFRICPRSFYTRPDATTVARELLGKVLVSDIQGITTAGIIVETEAYMGPDDLACHAHSNRRTPRSITMYENGGLAYVYICYGMHFLFNVVTGKQDMAHAVLVRALEPFHNPEMMLERRSIPILKPSVLNGPGKLSQALGIEKIHNGVEVFSPQSPIKIGDIGTKVDEKMIEAGPRVGMSHHTRHCGHFPWRFKIKGNRWVSKPDVVKYHW